MIVAQLRGIAPVGGASLCPFFEEILKDGASGKRFETSHNRDWTQQTRPIVEAFFHPRYFLEMVVRYGKELAPSPAGGIPSGWAALLCLYGLR